LPTVFIELSSSTTTKSDAIAISQPYKAAHEVIVVELVMPRFYFHLVSVDRQITDDHGKELSTLNDAYEHARKLIDKILCHLGSDDGKAWKVVALSEIYNVQIIVPFSASDLVFPRAEQSNSANC
jgi:hypothetical protein